MEDRLLELSKRMDSNHMLRGIRHALIMTIPVLMLGSFALLLKSFPIDIYQNFITTFADGILYSLFSVVYNSCFSFFSIYIVIGVSLCYMTEFTGVVEEYIIAPFISVAAFLIFTGAGSPGFNIKDLSVNGSFIALLSSIFVCMLYRRLKDFGKNLIKVGAAGGILYQKATQSIIPASIIIILCVLINGVIRIVFNVDTLLDLISDGISVMIMRIQNGYFRSLVYMLSVQLLWSAGIHGGNMLEQLVQMNFVEVSPDVIFNKTFYDVFINIGGCGATICILIAIFLKGKQQNMRNIARGAAIPVLFNINELVTFGFPIVLNPIMLIPFIIVPFVLLNISYIAMYTGIVPHVVQSVEWTTPVLLSGYIATGSVRGSILQIVCVAVGVLIYMPFISMHEKMTDHKLEDRVRYLTDILQQCEKDATQPNLLKRADVYGSTAKMLANELEQDIRRRKVFMMYQPQIDNNGKCIGAEALVRWDHPITGHMYPPLIVELAREGGFLDKLEQLIFDNACRTAKEAVRYLGENAKISVNITARSLDRDSLLSEIELAAQKYQLNPHCIWIEVTENDVLADTEGVTNKLMALKKCGHKLLIDDFSMGHTSLKYLQMQCFDGIKLDAAITKNVLEDRIGQEIIASITDLGKKLDVGIIAEYVENDNQQKILRELGCEFYQGYLYSKPLLEKDFIKYIDADASESY